MTNLNKLKKDEILWLYNNHCKEHRHRYIEHMGCFEKERGNLEDCKIREEKIGFLDIETSSLNATFGYVISYCIKELDGIVRKRSITPDEIRTKQYDARLLKTFYLDSKDFDRFVVYWGKDRRFDIPFLRSRCLRNNLDFPTYKEVLVTDLYDLVKGKLKIGRNSLVSACSYLGIPAKGTQMCPQIWMDAGTGDQKAIDTILEHNIEDVISTEALWKRMSVFALNPKTSI